MVELKKCIVCNTDFFKKNGTSNLNWNRQKMCSISCRSLSRKGEKFTEEKLKFYRLVFSTRKLPKGENHFRWKKEYNRKCFHCKKDLTTKQSGSKKGGVKYCSMKCWGLAHRGENSPVWVGEKSKNKLRNRLFHLFQYKQWHSTILKRDDYTCQICKKRNFTDGNKRVLLEVDHYPIPFRKIVDGKENLPISELVQLDKLWDTSNGRVLCRSCHRKNYH